MWKSLDVSWVSRHEYLLWRQIFEVYSQFPRAFNLLRHFPMTKAAIRWKTRPIQVPGATGWDKEVSRQCVVLQVVTCARRWILMMLCHCFTFLFVFCRSLCIERPFQSSKVTSPAWKIVIMNDDSSDFNDKKWMFRLRSGWIRRIQIFHQVSWSFWKDFNFKKF